MKKYTVIDLFAGVGGLSYGFYNNDAFQILLANELDKDTAIAYQLNHPTVKVLNCDIRDINQEVLKDNNIHFIDIVVGGPPCQSYSTLGKRRNDEKANLFLEYCRILDILQPKIFILENVTGMLSMLSGRLFQKMQLQFEKIGYQTKYQVLNALDYGVPQIRQRVILVGTKIQRNDLKKSLDNNQSNSQNASHFEFPQPTHGNKYCTKDFANLQPIVTLQDTLSDMPILQSGQTNNIYSTPPQNEFQKFVRQNCTQLTENTAPKNGNHLIKIMQNLPDGGNKNDLPLDIRPKSGYGNTYAKLWWQRPVPTITRNFACVSSSRCIHPRDSRALTTREGARLQSFPDSYQFYGSKSKKNLQIGNAVPPLLSIAIANSVQQYLEGQSIVNNKMDINDDINI